MSRQDVVRAILGEHPMRPGIRGDAFAPANIALCKYWGKRDEELNLPVTSSLSISLGKLGARTLIAPADKDALVFNGIPVPADVPMARRVFEFLDLFRASRGLRFAVTTQSNIPVAAGLASSASGFAALVLALDDLFGWNFERKDLSILARLGSGSACRSVYNGFVRWAAGERADGMDSFAVRMPTEWPDFRLGLLILSKEEKAVGSRPAMRRTTSTSALYQSWPGKVAKDLPALEEAIAAKAFPELGHVAESNAMAMHATMIDSWPPICYWRPETIETMHAVWKLREEGLPVYMTMDAGPNVKLLFLASSERDVLAAFPDMQVVRPFAD